MHIEALTMLEMVKKDILPAGLRYAGAVADTALKKKQLCPALGCAVEEELVGRLSALAAAL